MHNHNLDLLQGRGTDEWSIPGTGEGVATVSGSTEKDGERISVFIQSDSEITINPS